MLRFEMGWLYGAAEAYYLCWRQLMTGSFPLPVGRLTDAREAHLRAWSYLVDQVNEAAESAGVSPTPALTALDGWDRELARYYANVWRGGRPDREACTAAWLDLVAQLRAIALSWSSVDRDQQHDRTVGVTKTEIKMGREGVTVGVVSSYDHTP